MGQIRSLLKGPSNTVGKLIQKYMVLQLRCGCMMQELIGVGDGPDGRNVGPFLIDHPLGGVTHQKLDELPGLLLLRALCGYRHHVVYCGPFPELSPWQRSHIHNSRWHRSYVPCHSPASVDDHRTAPTRKHIIQQNTPRQDAPGNTVFFREIIEKLKRLFCLRRGNHA